MPGIADSMDSNQQWHAAQDEMRQKLAESQRDSRVFSAGLALIIGEYLEVGPMQDWKKFRRQAEAVVDALTAPGQP